MREEWGRNLLLWYGQGWSQTEILLCSFLLNPWSKGESFLVKKMDVPSPFPVFQRLNDPLLPYSPAGNHILNFDWLTPESPWQHECQSFVCCHCSSQVKLLPWRKTMSLSFSESWIVPAWNIFYLLTPQVLLHGCKIPWFTNNKGYDLPSDLIHSNPTE